MTAARCVPLPENARVFFGGVAVRPGAVVGPRVARRWREADTEWLRPLVEPAAWRGPWGDAGPPARRVAIDFSPGNAGRAEVESGRAWRRFRAAGGRIPQRGSGAELRIALAQCARFLAMPRSGPCREWRWVPSPFLPCGNLVALVRDDEWLAAVVASRWFAAWVAAHGGRASDDVVRAFPFPLKPDTPRGALTRGQEEHRAAVVQAARAAAVGGGGEVGGFAAEDLAAAVAAAYGWPGTVDEAGAVARLRSLHAQRGIVIPRRPL